ncbi:MAG TPA: arginine--tRNA ligase, partial [Gemmataceae bacterium]|nr:arginine--tRNA ligase [Gemmataceae bacterium]
MNLLNDLQQRCHHALTGLVPDPAPYAAMVQPAKDARFGDYQANCAMSLGKALGKPPREVAKLLVERLRLDDLLEPPEIAGPGFINLRLRTDWLARQVGVTAKDDRLGVAPVAAPKTFVIDYSSPNVAKPMHVGHIRSTIIGDALARLLRFLGHTVVTDNHLGDWGTQFGMILWGWKHHRDEQHYRDAPVQELARLYRLAQTAIKAGDAAVDEDSRAETAKLHAGDPVNRALWQEFMPHCLEALGKVYARLGVQFDEQRGESAYDAELAGVVADLRARGLAVDSEGAVCIFVEGTPTPFLIQKSDGAFNYGTTDLATIHYRERTHRPDAILYVVDHRQAGHFKQLFAVARLWGYSKTTFEHVAFGTIMGPDKKPYKTREGDVVGLESLLDEAAARARQVVDENSPELSAEERRQVAEIVGLGAVKY